MGPREERYFIQKYGYVETCPSLCVPIGNKRQVKTGHSRMTQTVYAAESHNEIGCFLNGCYSIMAQSSTCQPEDYILLNKVLAVVVSVVLAITWQ